MMATITRQNVREPRTALRCWCLRAVFVGVKFERFSPRLLHLLSRLEQQAIQLRL